MINFLKSTEADFQKLLNKISVIHKNILYLTYQVDFLRKKLVVDKDLQDTVDKYFDEDETSPQTDSDNKGDLD